jgi:hypothetical protein
LEAPEAPVRIIRQADNTFSITSASSDLRFMETTLLDPASIANYPLAGHAAAVVAVFVGFGVNCISAVKFGRRLALLNGTHRVHALLSLGIRHVPCVVRYASREDELDILGATDLRSAGHLYLRGPRPPLFKDYLDPTLTKIITAPRTDRVLQLQLNMQQWRASVAELEREPMPPAEG